MTVPGRKFIVVSTPAPHVHHILIGSFGNLMMLRPFKKKTIYIYSKDYRIFQTHAVPIHKRLFQRDKKARIRSVYILNEAGGKKKEKT